MQSRRLTKKESGHQCGSSSWCYIMYFNSMGTIAQIFIDGHRLDIKRTVPLGTVYLVC